jgi:hypothetical protein
LAILLPEKGAPPTAISPGSSSVETPPMFRKTCWYLSLQDMPDERGSFRVSPLVCEVGSHRLCRQWWGLLSRLCGECRVRKWSGKAIRCPPSSSASLHPDCMLHPLTEAIIPAGPALENGKVAMKSGQSTRPICDHSRAHPTTRTSTFVGGSVTILRLV